MALELTAAVGLEDGSKAGSKLHPSGLGSMRALILACLVLFGLHLGLAASLGLSEDEAYYRLWSLAPALSFLDHPPMVGWLIAAGRGIAGDSELGVRFLAPLLLAIGAIVQWRTAELLTDGATARLATWFYLSIPLLNVGGVIITPDLPSVMFFGLVIWALVELDRSQNANWWLAVGVFAGCGLLSKYTNIFAGVTILLWLLVAKENRKWFFAPQLWAGGLIALGMFAPVVAWNANHGWASFVKQFGRVGDGDAIGVAYLGEFLGGQIALLSPVIALLAMVGLWQLLKEGLIKQSGRPLLIVAAVLPLATYFVFHALHGRVQGNWPGPIYPMLAVCAAIAVRSRTQHASTRLALAALFTGALITAIIYAQALVPLVSLRKDPTGQMRGWEAMTTAIRVLVREHEAGWVATSSYGTTGQLAFGLRGDLPVAQLNDRVRHEHLPPLAEEAATGTALYVELERRSREGLLSECFAKIARIATVMRSDGTKTGAPYAVYRAEGLKPECAGERIGLHAAASSKPNSDRDAR